MRKIGLVLLVLAACGGKHPPLTIAITADGHVKLDGRVVTLDELGTLLAARRDAGPLEELASGAKVSSLPILLDVEDDALWHHVRWVMTIISEQRLWRVSLPGGRDAPLRVDEGIMVGPADGVALLARVLVLEDGRYALGDRTTRDAGEIGKWIDAGSREGLACRIGQIGDQPRVTWRLVRPVLDALSGKGMRRIDFPIAIPAPSVRKRSPLPPPRASPLPRSWPALRVVDYWSTLDTYEGEYGEDDVDPEEPVLPGEGLLALLDAHRGDLTLPDFAPDETLRRVAADHAEEMRRMGYFGHFSPVEENRSPSDRLAKQGWPEERRHAELLAKADTAQGAFDAILAKPENAACLADPAFKYAGVARSGDCWVVLLGAEP